MSSNTQEMFFFHAIFEIWELLALIPHLILDFLLREVNPFLYWCIVLNFIAGVIMDPRPETLGLVQTWRTNTFNFS